MNAAQISGLHHPYGIAVLGSHLFVTNVGGLIGEYTTSGATVNAALVSGLDPIAIAVVPTATTVPEPSTLTLLGLALAGLGFLARRQHTQKS